MTCEKCGYQDKREVDIFGRKLCGVCAHFSPEDKGDCFNYIAEKIDWKILDTFRKYKQLPGGKQKSGMSRKAEQGRPVTRAPLGYNIVGGKLTTNQDSARVHSLFKTFLSREYSLNSLSKNFGLSINGLKKVLTNRTYLGEIKFDGNLHKGDHKQLISPEIFYAVQRKLKDYLKPRKGNFTNKSA